MNTTGRLSFVLAMVCCFSNAQTGDQPRQSARSNSAKWLAVDNGWIDKPNGDQVCNLAKAVSVSKGVLTLTAKHETVNCRGGVDYGPAVKHWTGGTIYTKSFHFLYGSIEARIKSAGFGVHSGLLWMMGSGCQPIMYRYSRWCNGTWPNPNNEIDIAEIKPGVSKNLTTVYQNLLGDSNKWHDGNATTTDVSRNWHVYRLEWSPAALVFKIDGVAGTTFTTEIPYRPMFPIISTEFEDGGGGVPDAGAFPQTIQVDYVRAWDASGKLIFSDDFDDPGTVIQERPAGSSLP
jgi:beta-glucanase (GH16 family)